MEDIFAALEFEDVKVGSFRFRFPLRYFDYSLVGASFPVPVANLQNVLPSKKLIPIETTPGVSTVLLIATENRVVDCLKPYNEFDVMVPIRHETADGSGVSAYYCLYIPVTTEEALVGGVEIYGYPKFLADISFEETDETRRCWVRSEGKDILTLEVRKSVTELVSYQLYLYSVKGEHLLRALYQVQGQSSTDNVTGGASLILGDHPVARELKALEIGGTSVMHEYAPRRKALLHLPSERLPL